MKILKRNVFIYVLCIITMAILIATNLKLEDYIVYGYSEDEELDYFVQELIENVIEEDDLEKANYIQYQTSPIKNKLNIGDIMVDKTGNMYIVTYNTLKESKSNEKEYKWWKITNGGYKKTTSDVYDKENTFYYHELEEPLCIEINPLVAYYDTYLKDVSLPSGYKWVYGGVRLSEVRNYTFEVIYTPKNTIKYKTKKMNVVVKVQKLQKKINNLPNTSYTINYYPNNTLKSIQLPLGWEWENPNEVINKIGTTKYKAIYSKKDEYEYQGVTQMDVDIVVKKSSFSIDKLVITVSEGSVLGNEILPVFHEGVLTWETSNKKAYKNTTELCKFTPYDKEHYNSVENIPVVINVIPKSEKKTDNTSTEENKSENSSPTSEENVISEEKSDEDKKTTEDKTTEDKKTTVNLGITSSKTESSTDKANNTTNKTNNTNVTVVGLNDNKDTPLPDINIYENEGEKKLPMVSLLKGNTQEIEIPTNNQVSYDELQTEVVVGDILEDQYDDSEKTSEEADATNESIDKEEDETKKEDETKEEDKTAKEEKDKGVDFIGIAVLASGIGCGIYTLIKRLKRTKRSR